MLENVFVPTPSCSVTDCQRRSEVTCAALLRSFRFGRGESGLSYCQDKGYRLAIVLYPTVKVQLQSLQGTAPVTRIVLSKVQIGTFFF